MNSILCCVLAAAGCWLAAAVAVCVLWALLIPPTGGDQR